MHSYDEVDRPEPPEPSAPKAAAKRNVSARILSFLLVPVCWIYFMGLMLAMPYFNWCYARDHGFVSWICLGEVVATAKALAWPYYAFAGSSGPSFTEEEKATLAHLGQAIELRNQAFRLLKPKEEALVYSVSEEDQQLAIGLLRKSIEESEQIPDSVLAKLHEDLPSRMETLYRKGTRMFIEGIRLGRPDLSFKGQQLMNEFGEWYNEEVKSKYK